MKKLILALLCFVALNCKAQQPAHHYVVHIDGKGKKTLYDSIPAWQETHPATVTPVNFIQDSLKVYSDYGRIRIMKNQWQADSAKFATERSALNPK